MLRSKEEEERGGLQLWMIWGRQDYGGDVHSFLSCKKVDSALAREWGNLALVSLCLFTLLIHSVVYLLCTKCLAKGLAHGTYLIFFE